MTCSGNQAWTVELFGYAYGDVAVGHARVRTRRTSDREPGAGGSSRGRRADRATRSTAPARPYGPNGAMTTTGGQFPYPFAVASVPGEPNGASPTTVVGHGRHHRRQRLLAGAVGRIGDPPR